MTLLSHPEPHFDHRLFVGIFPGGIVYADRQNETRGDYERLAFLPYNTLLLDMKEGCPCELLAQIEAHAVTLQSHHGELFRISACGQTVRLG